jgi:hypothetical protein
MITRAEVELSGARAVLTQDGKKLQLTQLSGHSEPFAVQSLDPPPHRYDKRIEGLKRIELTVPVPAERKDAVEIEIELKRPTR